MKTTFKFGMAIFAILLMLSSCATIMSGSKASITINGIAPERLTVSTSDSVYQVDSLPFVVKVKRKKLDLPIKFASENYTYPDFTPGSTVNGWLFANIAIGGVIGIAVDCSTGANIAPKQDNIHLMPTRK